MESIKEETRQRLREHYKDVDPASLPPKEKRVKLEFFLGVIENALDEHHVIALHRLLSDGAFDKLKKYADYNKAI